MSKKIISAPLTEGQNRSQSRPLTDDELNVVAGGVRTNADNPFVQAVMRALHPVTLEIGEVTFLA